MHLYWIHAQIGGASGFAVPMPQGRPQFPDIDAGLRQIEAEIVHPMPARDLIRIRNLFDDATFLPELKKLLLRLDNTPDYKTAVLARLTFIMREAEGLRDKRNENLSELGLSKWELEEALLLS